MAKPAGRKKVRVQLDFQPEAYASLLQLQAETGAPSLVETVRYSLRTLQWVAQTVRVGATILVEKNGKQQLVVFPFIVSHPEPEIIEV